MHNNVCAFSTYLALVSNYSRQYGRQYTKCEVECRIERHDYTNCY